MRTVSKFVLVVLLLGAITLPAWARTTYTGYSGAPGSRGRCASSCHGAGGGTIQASGFPSVYVPGQSYTITVSHAGTDLIANFNASCRIGTGSQNAGVITAGTNTATYNTSLETNGVHLSPSFLDGGTFTWTAPAAGTGDVNLYICGIEADYDGPNTILSFTAAEQAPATGACCAPAGSCATYCAGCCP